MRERGFSKFRKAIYFIHVILGYGGLLSTIVVGLIETRIPYAALGAFSYVILFSQYYRKYNKLKEI